MFDLMCFIANLCIKAFHLGGISQDEFTPRQECQCDACAEHWLPGGAFSFFFLFFVCYFEANQNIEDMTQIYDSTWMNVIDNDILATRKLLPTLQGIAMFQFPHDLPGTGGSNSHWATKHSKLQTRFRMDRYYERYMSLNV